MSGIFGFQDETFQAVAVDRVSVVASEGPSHCFSVDLRGGQQVWFYFTTEAKARTGHSNFIQLWEQHLTSR